MNHRFGTFALTLCLGLLVAAGSAQAELKVGDEAPAFEMQGSDGKTYKSSDFNGKQAVVIAWFPKAFTGGCTKQCKAMREQGDKLRAYDVAYFTASVDDQPTNAKFAKSLGLDYPILCDPEKSAAKAFGVVNAQRGVAQRWTFIIGKDNKILAIDKSVNTTNHGNDVAAKLDELGVEKKK